MKRSLLLFGCLLLLASPAVRAAVSDDEIQALREQIRLLSARLDQLEQAARDDGSAEAPVAETTRPPHSPTAAAEDLDQRIDEAVDARVKERMAAVAWAERINWSGDFRYRFENIQQEGTDDRDRSRIRARAALKATISDTMRVGLGLASGSDDPVSSNQTLGSGGSTKPLGIDLAYFEWTGLANTAITGGKYKNPLQQVGGNPLVWDSDWRPEGFSFSTGAGPWFASGIATWLESDSKNSQHEFSYGLQGGALLAIGQHAELMVGAGYYDIGAAGKKSFFGDGDFFGNSFDPGTGTYVFDYQVVEGFAELALQGFGRPLTLFGAYVTNLDADDEDSGYSFGFQYGEAKARGTWEFGYTYKKLEADAVLGLLTDSDFGGGGTNARGSAIGAAYAFDNSLLFEVTYLLNETGLKSASPGDYDRLQVDLSLKYK